MAEWAGGGESWVEVVLEEAGEWDMIYDRARRMITGMGLPCDPPRGAFLLRRAAEVGNHHAAAWDLAALVGEAKEKDEAKVKDEDGGAADEGEARRSDGNDNGDGAGTSGPSSSGGSASEAPAIRKRKLPTEDENLEWSLDWSKAAASYAAALKSDPRDRFALFNLGLCHYDGEGVTWSQEDAVELFKRAAEEDYLNGLNSLALCYFRGHGTPWEQDTAVKLFMQGAKRGYIISQFNLGYCYEFGKGVEKDAQLSAYNYIKSACQGDVAALKQLSEQVLREPAFGRKKVEYHIPSLASLCLAVCRKRGVGRAIRVRTAAAHRERERMRAEKRYRKAKEAKGDLTEDDGEVETNVSVNVEELDPETARLPLDVLQELNEGIGLCVRPSCESWFYGRYGRVRWVYPIAPKEKTENAPAPTQKVSVEAAAKGEEEKADLPIFSPRECITNTTPALHGDERVVALAFCSVECHNKAVARSY